MPEVATVKIGIEQEDPRRAEVAELVRALDIYHESLYPPEANHHLDIDSLCKPDIVFLVGRLNEEAMGIGALWLRVDLGFGEVKRMYVRPAARGTLLAQALIRRIEDTAQKHKLTRLMLETGTHNIAALKLYERAGFTRRGPFGGYRDHPLSVFMEKTLAP